MLSIFKRNKNSELVIENTSNYPKEVLEIHHEFNTAADKLLLEAKQIISEAVSKDVHKVNRLELLGFKQAAQVTELKPLQQKAELSREQLESLAYYQRKYPLNKFITEEQVKSICHKYNLVCGDVDRFKGFVPEKNLKDIENFKLKENDIKYYRIYNMFAGRFMETEISKSDYLNQSNSRAWTRDSFYTFKKGTKLQICAPVKDMDLIDLELVEGYKLTKKHIPDPVVLQPVKNGYLIITMWADETFDPFQEEILRNDKMNN